MKFWKFEILVKMSGSHCLNLHKTCFENPRSWNNSPTSNLNFSLSLFFDINGKMDLKTLVWTPSISAQHPQTFDLLWAKPFENHVFRPQSQRGKIADFQTPAARHLWKKWRPEETLGITTLSNERSPWKVLAKFLEHEFWTKTLSNKDLIEILCHPSQGSV